MYINESNVISDLKSKFNDIINEYSNKNNDSNANNNNPVSDNEIILTLLATVEKNSTHPIAKAIVDKSNELSNDLYKKEKISDFRMFIENSISNFENISGKGIKANLIIENNEYSIVTGNNSIIDKENITIKSESLEKYETLENQNKTTIF